MEPFESNPLPSSIDVEHAHPGTLLLFKKTPSHSKKLSVEFDFVGSSQKESSSNWSVSEFLPTFNTDKKYYTPAFILKMDTVLLELFSAKIQDSRQGLLFTSSRQGSV